MDPARSQYSTVAIVLHWAIAAAIVGNFAIGWWMHHAIDVAETQARAIDAYQLHKSIGLSILLLSLLRLAWRLTHRPPALPAHMPNWERLAAKATHWAFYALMIGIPLSGWLYVSTQWRGDAPLQVPTLWFGLIEVPHLFGLHAADLELRKTLAEEFIEAHEWLAGSAMFLLILHIGAALKHQFIDRDEVLSHMVPMMAKQPDHATSWALRTGMGLILLAIAAVLYSLFATPGSSLNNGTAHISSSGNWSVVPEHSEIAFSGAHAGKPFRGRFSEWHAELQLDPDNPTASRINVTIQTASASDGVPLHDKSLPEAEWFDVARHPNARFKATRFEPGEGNQLDVYGELAIKNQILEVGPFSLQLDETQARFKGEVSILRSAANLGMESDPGAEWVSREISISVDAIARPRS